MSVAQLETSSARNDPLSDCYLEDPRSSFIFVILSGSLSARPNGPSSPCPRTSNPSTKPKVVRWSSGLRSKANGCGTDLAGYSTILHFTPTNVFLLIRRQLWMCVLRLKRRENSPIPFGCSPTRTVNIAGTKRHISRTDISSNSSSEQYRGLT